MSQIKKPHLTFTYIDAPDSKKRLQRAYKRIFAIARRNLYEKQRSGKLDTGKLKNRV